ncbi:MAG: hypothetical protein WD770_02055 [Actinomycetota bacterium]
MRTRRVLGILLGVLLLVGLVSPALAVERQTRSRSLNAFWYSYETLGPNTFRQTTWYVGAFASSGRFGGTWSDLYQSVDLCRETRRGTVCENEYFAIGFKELTRDEFFIDERRLATGWIDATYDLETYHAYSGEPEPGPAVPTHILATFEGVGPIETSKETFVYEDENFIFRFTFQGAFRTAESYGWIDGVSIGETYDAYMSLSTSTEQKQKV